MPDGTYLSAKELCKIVKKSRNWLAYMERKGLFVAEDLGPRRHGKKVYYCREQVDVYLKKGEVGLHKYQQSKAKKEVANASC